MARGPVLKNTFTRDTLFTIAAVGVIVVAASTSPYFLHRVVKAYFRDKGRKLKQARARKLRELEKRKLISFKELGGGSVRIELTHRGKTLVRTYDLEKMKLVKPKRWDGKWRVIIYDIPTAKRKASNAFREKLRALGFFPLQKSVWIHPHECLPEVEFLATVFEIDMDRHIYYFSTSEIPREKEIRKFFSM